MEANYKNRMSQGMVLGFAAGTAACAGISGLAYGLMADGNLRTAVCLDTDIGSVLSALQ